VENREMEVVDLKYDKRIIFGPMENEVVLSPLSTTYLMTSI